MVNYVMIPWWEYMDLNAYVMEMNVYVIGVILIWGPLVQWWDYVYIRVNIIIK